jgi:hypothetical protein
MRCGQPLEHEVLIETEVLIRDEVLVENEALIEHKVLIGDEGNQKLPDFFGFKAPLFHDGF